MQGPSPRDDTTTDRAAVEALLCIGNALAELPGPKTMLFFGWTAADDVDAVYENCQAQGLDVIMPPTDEPWNVREIHVRHPDGHVFRISKGLE